MSKSQPKTQMRIVPKTEPKPRVFTPPEMSARWTTQFVKRRDTLAGTFEMLNSPLTNLVEVQVQRALLSPLKYRFSAQRITEAQHAVRNIQKGK
jgi:hypothetical protein